MMLSVLSRQHPNKLFYSYVLPLMALLLDQPMQLVALRALTRASSWAARNKTTTNDRSDPLPVRIYRLAG